MSKSNSLQGSSTQLEEVQPKKEFMIWKRVPKIIKEKTDIDKNIKVCFNN